jgi:hypothetical protein
MFYWSLCLKTTVTVFWTIYVYDRELIFPSSYDILVPLWINHAWHTLPLFTCIANIMLKRRIYERFQTGFSYTLAYTLVYLTLLVLIFTFHVVLSSATEFNGLSFLFFLFIQRVFYLGIFRNHWVYPFLQIQTNTSRICIVIFMTCVNALNYKIGESLNWLVWQNSFWK